ncbi:Protein DYAD [Platanthera guangdongensis]|uniref:Protein DYAD n=1 Tax=Platanthera guangdongensis TaxID=2320717 RepID=A0ABR2LC66_9ASPA
MFADLIFFDFWCLDCYVPGGFYEIDHEKLPPKSPIQLKAVRIVMVTDTTSLDVTVSFPSTLALRRYFAAARNDDGSLPELDERFVMSSNQAGRILRWRIPPAHLDAGKLLKSFWILTPASSVSEKAEDDDDDKSPVRSTRYSCLQSLKRAEVFGWGIRKKVKYIGQCCASAEEEDGENNGGRRKRRREVVSINDDTKKEMKKKNKINVEGREMKKPKATGKETEGRSAGRGSKDRWSTERYETAEKRLLEIMRTKKAELRTPVLRQTLRDEARKHIGDTGLLDHLLKHMAGKIVLEGTHRFRRRHNSEGAMEYWLEPAELLEIRRKAGVDDPFWVPPPEWKLGDSIFQGSCGQECKLAIAELKQQLAAQSSRVHEQQIWLKKLEKEARENKEESQKAISSCQEKCQILLEWKLKQEEELSALRLLKEKMRSDHIEPSKGCVSTTTNIRKEITGDSASFKKVTPRSGFRICKPQGTFLWPSNGVSAMSELEQKQHLFLFPGGGPPSASSSTASTAKLLLLPAPRSASLSLNTSTEIMAVPDLLKPQGSACCQNLCSPEYVGPMPCVSAVPSTKSFYIFIYIFL